MDKYVLFIEPAVEGGFRAELELVKPRYDRTIFGEGYGETAAEAAIRAVAEIVSDPGHHID